MVGCEDVLFSILFLYICGLGLLLHFFEIAPWFRVAFVCKLWRFFGKEPPASVVDAQATTGKKTRIKKKLPIMLAGNRNHCKHKPKQYRKGKHVQALPKDFSLKTNA